MRSKIIHKDVPVIVNLQKKQLRKKTGRNMTRGVLCSDEEYKIMHMSLRRGKTKNVLYY